MRRFSRYYFVMMVAIAIVLIAGYILIPDPAAKDGLAVGAIFGFLLGSAFESFWINLYRECDENNE